MSTWEDDYLDEAVEAFIRFDGRGSGSFQFGYVHGELDYRVTNRDGLPAVEFSWEGGDDADASPLLGRAWAVLRNGTLEGEFFIHQGDESSFTAVR
jgi:hypothetical protein